MNQVTQFLEEAFRLPSHSPGSGGDCWEERNQLSLEQGKKGGTCDAQGPLAAALRRQIWS